MPGNAPPDPVRGTNMPAVASSKEPKSAQSRRHVVFPDPVAFRHLEVDPTVEVVERRGTLEGYELYLVEQWACSRESPTLVIVSYTGDPTHAVIVGVLSIPTDEESWSPRLKAYFDAIQLYHARPRQTPLGELMVTNLSSFSSALTVIQVPDGDIRRHREAFVVNEDLKRMGCSGRSGMTLSAPTSATQAKFLSMYKTHERIPLNQAVQELVKMCQFALFMFALLDQEYIDGLLCDKTETAIANWWTEIGTEYYDDEPSDGILGPTTVSALLGMLLGARNRLASFGAPVTKDAFDVESIKKGIGYFQKSQKLDVTRRLDRSTLAKLHNVTAKAASGERWGVQRAVRSTAAEFGKRGEILSGMVGAKDKAGISEVETLDIETFISLIHGDRAKWLWQGRPRKSTIDNHHLPSLPDMGNRLFGGVKEGDSPESLHRRVQSMPPEGLLDLKTVSRRGSTHSRTISPQQSIDHLSDREGTRKAVFRSVAGRVNDARSGLGRIREGIKGHIPRPSRDENHLDTTTNISSLVQTSASASASASLGRAFTWKNKPQEYLQAFRRDGEVVVNEATQTSETSSLAAAPKIQPRESSFLRVNAADDDHMASRTVSATASSVAVSDTPFDGMRSDKGAANVLLKLARRSSISYPQSTQTVVIEDRLLRRMSFSVAEEAVLQRASIDSDFELDSNNVTAQSLAKATDEQTYELLSHLQLKLRPWTDDQVASVAKLDQTLANQQGDLQAAREQLLDAFQQGKATSQDLLGEERAHITEAIRDVEVMIAKLDYEINGIEYKVRDVEDGVLQFEAQVEEVEARAEELKMQLETESWLHWAVRTLTGIGTGPNIVRERG